MKFLRVAIFTALTLASAEAKERTITTRDGKVYAKAEFSEIGPRTVKVSHEGGITTVYLEDLPADLQKEFGYKTLAERQVENEQMEGRRQQQQVVESQSRDEALKAAREKKLKAAFYAIPSATLAEANAFLSVSRDALLEKLGDPIRAVHTDISGGGFTTLYYDERKPTRTVFVIRDGSAVVSSGVYKGVAFQGP